MNPRAQLVAVLLPALIALVAGCQKAPEPAVLPTPAATPVVESAAAPAPVPATAAPEVALPAATPVAPTSAEATATAAAPAAMAFVASQDTNWTGVVAEVTEFRRKGNTLTAKLRFRNGGTAGVQPDLQWPETYLLDTAAGKKYEPLKDENGAYIAGNRPGWKDRWYDDVKAGESRTTWVKFPAPPAEVRVITLQLPNIAPFEDLPIQD